jgi:hypothetical protein
MQVRGYMYIFILNYLSVILENAEISLSLKLGIYICLNICIDMHISICIYIHAYMYVCMYMYILNYLSVILENAEISLSLKSGILICPNNFIDMHISICI